MGDTSAVVIAGEFADHPQAVDFAAHVQHVHYRYASEIVGRYELCPFMSDPESAFGRFCVMLEREPHVDTALAQVKQAEAQVLHLIYPLVEWEVSSFERFGNRLHESVAKALDRGPVHATFHPRMEGDTSGASRLVGFLRRAPDPFIQFVPEGLHAGGTMFIDPGSVDLKKLAAEPSPKDRRVGIFERLTTDDFAAIRATIDDIRRSRNERYASFLDALA